MTEKEKVKQWYWIVDYCKKEQIPPAQSWAWEIGEREYKKYLENKNAVNL